MASPAIYGGSRTKILTQQGLLLRDGTTIDYNGPKNYITYGSFPINATTGWSLAHTTLSSNVPNQVSASWTAASANLSISTQVINALSKAGYSLALASSSATTPGDMLVSQNYTIDRMDQGKVLSFRFYYSAVGNPLNNNFSGTVANTWHIYIYDSTNNAWIQPSSVYGMNQGSGVGFVSCEWQTPINLISFRVAIVCVNASAGLTTLYFDDFFNGPSSAVSMLYTAAIPTGTLGSAYNLITYGNKVKDSHNAYISGIWTCPISGVYHIEASFLIQHAAVLANTIVAISIFVDDVETYSSQDYVGNTVNTNANRKISVSSVPLLAGQTIRIKSLSTGTTPTYPSAQTYNFFSIVRVGDY